MKTLKYLIVIPVAIGMYSCAAGKPMASDPNIGPIEIEIKAVAGKDSLVKTAEGKLIGKIDKDGNILDSEGNKIGKRKLTDAESIRLFGY